MSRLSSSYFELGETFREWSRRDLSQFLILRRKIPLISLIPDPRVPRTPRARAAARSRAGRIGRLGPRLLGRGVSLGLRSSASRRLTNSDPPLAEPRQRERIPADADPVTPSVHPDRCDVSPDRHHQLVSFAHQRSHPVEIVPETGVDSLTGWVVDRTSTYRTCRERSFSLLCPQMFSDFWTVLLRESSRSRLRLGRVA